MLRGNELRTLAGDGLKHLGKKVVHFTINHAGKSMFKDSVYQGSIGDTEDYHKDLYDAQLHKDVDGKELNPM